MIINAFVKVGSCITKGQAYFSDSLPRSGSHKPSPVEQSGRLNMPSKFKFALLKKVLDFGIRNGKELSCKCYMVCGAFNLLHAVLHFSICYCFSDSFQLDRVITVRSAVIMILNMYCTSFSRQEFFISIEIPSGHGF